MPEVTLPFNHKTLFDSIFLNPFAQPRRVAARSRHNDALLLLNLSFILRCWMHLALFRTRTSGIHSNQAGTGLHVCKRLDQNQTLLTIIRKTLYETAYENIAHNKQCNLYAMACKFTTNFYQMKFETKLRNRERYAALVDSQSKTSDDPARDWVAITIRPKCIARSANSSQIVRGYLVKRKWSRWNEQDELQNHGHKCINSLSSSTSQLMHLCPWFCDPMYAIDAFVSVVSWSRWNTTPRTQMRQLLI